MYSSSVINHEKNKGIGEALCSGYKNATKENVLITCGDGQFDLNELLPFKEIDDKTVLALYRKENTSYSLHRNILSYFNKLFNKILISPRVTEDASLLTLVFSTSSRMTQKSPMTPVF